MSATDNEIDRNSNDRNAGAPESVEALLQRETTARLAAETALRESEEQFRLYKEQLVQLNKMASLGFLVSGVAHEINNPTNYISMSAPLLRRAWECIAPLIKELGGGSGDIPIGGMHYREFAENLDRLMHGIEEGSHRIKRIVADLKDYAHKSPGDLHRIIDLNSIVQSTTNIMNTAIRKRTKHFFLDFHKSPLYIKGNPQRLEQVVVNLVQNACDALSSPDQALAVSVECREAGHAAVVVRDQGCGISPEDLSKITDPFFTTKGEKGGTGLGLSVSAAIVKEHGGRLTFQSEVGKGTTAILFLPRSA